MKAEIITVVDVELADVVEEEIEDVDEINDIQWEMYERIAKDINESLPLYLRDTAEISFNRDKTDYNTSIIEE